MSAEQKLLHRGQEALLVESAFDDVGVGSRLEPATALMVGIVRGQDDDGRLAQNRGSAVRLTPPAEVSLNSFARRTYCLWQFS